MNFETELIKCYANGLSDDDALSKLKEVGASPIECISALRSVKNITLGEAKRIFSICPSWRVESKHATEMHSEIEKAISKLIEYCPVCGYGPFEQPYISANEIRQSYDICDCCGCEYGNDDNEAHYDEWIAKGCPWFNSCAKPKNWSVEKQQLYIVRPWPPNKTGT
jgi:hypothetical protein